MNKSDNLPEEWVERIFMRLHGRFGNTFLNKFKIGKLNDDGDDVGIINAKATWAYELRHVTSTRLKAGLDSDYDKAPDCDLFKSKCVLQAEVTDYKAITSKVDHETARQYADNVVKMVSESTRKSSRDWVKHWNDILDNPVGEKEITLTSARKALVNLGHPYKAKENV